MAPVYAINISGTPETGFDVLCRRHGDMHFSMHYGKLILAMEVVRSHIDEHLQAVRFNQEIGVPPQ